MAEEMVVLRHPIGRGCEECGGPVCVAELHNGKVVKRVYACGWCKQVCEKEKEG